MKTILQLLVTISISILISSNSIYAYTIDWHNYPVGGNSVTVTEWTTDGGGSYSPTTITSLLQ